MKMLSYFPLELAFWVAALFLLATANPVIATDEHHFTLCPLAALGQHWCPGCGIGRSITQLLNGNLSASLQHHWFGLPALIILVFRVGTLLRLEFNKLKSLKLI